jgi:D-glycero-alpha-D-manno-heptose-7-phosphate kinase
VAVNAAISLHVRSAVRRSAVWHLVAQELGAHLTLDTLDDAATDQRLALHLAALRFMRPSAPVTLSSTSDVPPGSGLGSSGALGVTMAAALAADMGQVLEASDAAARAFELETRGAGIPGGRQDQYAAALGGFNCMRFRDSTVAVEPIRLDPSFADALAASTVLCYTGASRLSGGTIARVMAAYGTGHPRVTGALRAMRDVALEMHEALAGADLGRVAALLSRNWTAQQALDPGMRTAAMARLEAAMRAAGSLGGKAAGSGAGGCMFFVCRDAERARRAALAAGAQLLPVAWAPHGVRVA